MREGVRAFGEKRPARWKGGERPPSTRADGRIVDRDARRRRLGHRLRQRRVLRPPGAFARRRRPAPRPRRPHHPLGFASAPAAGGARPRGLRPCVRDAPAAAEGRLDRDALLEGADALLGDWFAAAWADERRRAHGIAFRTVAERGAFDPASRARHAAVGALARPSHRRTSAAGPRTGPWRCRTPTPPFAACAIPAAGPTWARPPDASPRCEPPACAKHVRDEVHAQALPRVTVATRGT